MDQYEYGEHHFANAEHVRVAGFGLGAVEELQHPGHAEQPIGAHDYRAREHERRTAAGRPPQVRQVGGQQAQQVRFPLGRAEVVLPQLVRIANHQPLVQETWKKLRHGLVGACHDAANVMGPRGGRTTSPLPGREIRSV